MPESLLKGVFATLAVIAVLLLPLKARDGRDLASSFKAPAVLVIAIGVLVGVLLGMIGAGGGFLLVPVMLLLLRVPLRTAFGTSLAVVAMSAAAGAVGKILTGQVDFVLALALVAGALPGAQCGAAASHRVSPGLLTLILGLFISAAAIRMWVELLN